jgi:cell division cycle 14
VFHSFKLIFLSPRNSNGSIRLANDLPFRRNSVMPVEANNIQTLHLDHSNENQDGDEFALNPGRNLASFGLEESAVKIFGNVHLAPCKTIPNRTSIGAKSHYFCLDDFIMSSYVSFCDDFGPMNLGTLYEFCLVLDEVLSQHQDRPIAMQTKSESRSFTNAVFLLGAYMIIRLGECPDKVGRAFESLSHLLASYRDVSPGRQNFNLYVRDCWDGLWRAKQLGWVDFGPEGFDRDEYCELDSPLNADLHVVVPGKFVAMRGPMDFEDGGPWQDSFQGKAVFSHRDFSPAHYSEILTQVLPLSPRSPAPLPALTPRRQFDVQVVVRLNSPEYDAEGFRAAGIAVADLYFEDCTVPPVEVVAEFLTLAEGLPGALAVHCKAGLGRTGTLIALYMMKHHGFTAREAMGWLRIARPGSVIGQQQHFLCDKEALMHQCGEAFRRRSAARRAPLPPGAGLAEVEAYLAEVLRDIRSRAAALHGAAPAAAAAAECGAEAARLAAHVAAAANRRSGARASAPA